MGMGVWWGLTFLFPVLPQSLRFGLATGVLILGPGAALTWAALGHLPLSRRLVLACGFGFAAAPFLVHVLATVGLANLYPYLAAACTGVVALRPERPPAGVSRATLLPLALLCAVALAVTGLTYTNRVDRLPDRTIYYGEYDTFDITYYAAIASELTHTIPPASPFYAAHDLNHAFYPQLPVSLLRLHADIPVLDTYFRYIWPVYLSMAALMCFVFVESIATQSVAFLSALLLIVGSDLSYLAAWFYPRLGRRWDDVVWSANFLSPGAETLLFNNWTPTLVVVFAGLYSLAAHERAPRRLWLLLAGGCFAVTAQFKPFTFVALGAALVAVTIVSRRDRTAFYRFLAVTTVFAVGSVPYVLRILTLADDAQVTMQGDFLILPRTLLNRLSLEKPWLDWASSLGFSGPAQVALVGLASTPLFLIGGLGVRIGALPGVIACLWRPLQHSPVWRMLAWTIVAAMVPPFLVSTAPDPNETVQFHQFALFLLPIFLAQRVMRLPRPTSRAIAGCLVVALAVPSTVHYVHRKWQDGQRPMITLSADEMRAAAFLRHLDPDSVVLLHHQPRSANLLVIVSERRSVLAWGSYVRGRGSRVRDIVRFYRSARLTEEFALAVLDKYRPTHVLVYPATDHVHPKLLARLRPVFGSPEVMLYEVPGELGVTGSAGR
jgi:hypothetical protein